MTPRPAQSSVAGDQGAVQRLGQDDVRRVVRRDGVAQVEGAATQLVRRRPTPDGEIIEVGQEVVGTNDLQMASQGETANR